MTIKDTVLSVDSWETKKQALLTRLQNYGRVAVAFSGGVDSSVVAQAAFLACGKAAVAVTAVSDSLARGEREEAEQLARQIGIRHVIMPTDEFADAGYRENSPQRCFHCKSELYEKMSRQLSEWDADVIVNGANLDDDGDYRPGMQAARDYQVQSPLRDVGFNKGDVRRLAREWDLPVWDKPASPCLSSRVAYGVEVTPERVQRVDEAERFLRERFGLRELRVRHEANDLARIEIPVSALPRLADDELRNETIRHLRELGFKYVTLDLEGFRSGSMNLVHLTLNDHTASNDEIA